MIVGSAVAPSQAADRVPPRPSIVAAGLLALVVTIAAACQADRGADATPVSGVTEVVASGTWAHRFDRPGEYRYTCTVHAGMDGRVVVTA
jgi:Copper binding proteins, plastocyanin/azurin family